MARERLSAIIDQWANMRVTCVADGQRPGWAADAVCAPDARPGAAISNFETQMTVVVGMCRVIFCGGRRAIGKGR